MEQVENVPLGCVSQIVDDTTYSAFDLIGKGANITEPWPERCFGFENKHIVAFRENASFVP